MRLQRVGCNWARVYTLKYVNVVGHGRGAPPVVKDQQLPHFLGASEKCTISGSAHRLAGKSAFEQKAPGKFMCTLTCEKHWLQKSNCKLVIYLLLQGYDILIPNTQCTNPSQSLKYSLSWVTMTVVQDVTHRKTWSSERRGCWRERPWSGEMQNNWARGVLGSHEYQEAGSILMWEALKKEGEKAMGVVAGAVCERYLGRVLTGIYHCQTIIRKSSG